MKRLLRTAVTLPTLLLLVGAPLAGSDAGRPRVAVLEFKNKAEGYAWEWYRAGQAAQDMLVTELVKKGNFRVMEREQLAAIMEEKHLSLSGDVDPKTAVKLGKMIGVEYLIAGAVTELGVADRDVNVPSALFGGRLPSVNVRSQKMDAAVDARAFSTSTGEIVWADTASESTSDSSVYVAGAGGGCGGPQEAGPAPSPRRRQTRRLAQPDEDLDEWTRRRERRFRRRRKDREDGRLDPLRERGLGGRR